MNKDKDVMSWNHRVFHEIVDDEECFTIREAFYDDANKETPRSWTVEAVAPFGNTLDELRTELERMLRACDRPVLECAESEGCAQPPSQTPWE